MLIRQRTNIATYIVSRALLIIVKQVLLVIETFIVIKGQVAAFYLAIVFRGSNTLGQVNIIRYSLGTI
jgi:hypothetical protein